MTVLGVDRPRAIRPGEELDVTRLSAYLAALPNPITGPLTVQQFPGGHSNLTYLLDVGGRELVLRRPPFGSKVKSAHDMGREYRLLSRLAEVFPRAPRPVAACEDEAILGCRFYLMERVRGVILRGPAPKGFAPDEAGARRLCESFVDALVELHALDYTACGLADLGRPDGYLERQVSGWTKRYLDAKTDELPDVEGAAAWLAAHLPRSGPATLLHNDYKYDNLVLDPADPTRIVGILDWEMATLGDPLVDLGTALCYWVEAGDPPELRAFQFGPTALPGSFTRRELCARYAEQSGRALTDAPFYYAFGCWKTAVVAQQIYARYQAGLTRDERFAKMIDGVRVLGRQAMRALSGEL